MYKSRKILYIKNVLVYFRYSLFFFQCTVYIFKWFRTFRVGSRQTSAACSFESDIKPYQVKCIACCHLQPLLSFLCAFLFRAVVAFLFSLVNALSHVVYLSGVSFCLTAFHWGHLFTCAPAFIIYASSYSCLYPLSIKLFSGSPSFNTNRKYIFFPRAVLSTTPSYTNTKER